MRRWLGGLLCLLALVQAAAIPAAAYDAPEDFTGQTLEEIVNQFRQENGLDTGNFALSYYNTVTGESYDYNADKFMVAASTFKVPLNMYYYEMERDGDIASDAYIPEAGVTLDVAHRESLVRSNNECSIGMLYHLGVFSQYKKCMMKYFTMDPDKIDAIYYADNYYCTHMMMDALKYLYENSGDFEEMLDYMKQAQPDEYFAAGVPEDCEVAHKYGWFEGAVNDVGVIYTQEPFLLAVYTQDAGEWVVTNAAKLLYAYNTWNSQPEEPERSGVALEVEMKPLDEELPEEPEEAVPEETAQPEPAPEQPRKAFEWWMPVVALVVFGLGGSAAALIFNPKRLEKHYKDEDDESEESMYGPSD